jgi:alpha-tubulin suppressor-like RCC1 family protein
LKSDGTVVAAGSNVEGQCDVDDWKDISAIFTSNYSTVGLKSDGTVVIAGYNEDGQYDDVYNWKDIVAVIAGTDYIVGVKSDGTVVATGENKYLNEVKKWTDILVE